MPQQPPSLSTRAAAVFSDLYPAERLLLKSVELGQLTVLPKTIGAENQRDATGKIEPHLVRADVLHWMCTDREAVTLVAGGGIRLEGGKITGELNLSYADVPFALDLKDCSIPDGIRLEYSTIRKLTLDGCVTSRMWAVWLVVTNDLSLSRGFRATEGVIVDRARIAGDFYCEGSVLIKPLGTALGAVGARIDGSVHLTQGFHAEGEVNFSVSVIGGNLICAHSQIHNPVDDSSNNVGAPKRAFIANQIRVGGSVFLRDGLEIVGESQLIAASITGDLDCRGARFINPGKPSLSADRISVGRDVYFRDGFETDGILRLGDATIEGSIDFHGSMFSGQATNGVDLEAATVKKTILWKKVGLSSTTRLVLSDVSAGRYLDDEESWPAAGSLSLFGFKYGRIAGVKTAQRRRQWLGLQDKDNINLQPFRQLAAALREAGQDSEAVKVLIEKEDERYKHVRMRRRSRVWGKVLKYTIGYGYAPSRAIYPCLAVVILGWLVFWQANQHGLFSPTSDGVYRDAAYQSEHAIPNGYQTFNSLIYSIDVFLPIVDLHQESNWLPNPNQRCRVGGSEQPCGMLLRFYLWLHIIVGWGLTTLAVAGFSGLVRKE